ncbi:MAG: acyl dehydratase [Rhodospirillaceae bacterium]|jgi:acyl dehydratase|nr:acyl dehydratase [Rhodospirillaceae bacterium]MBT5300240.1 acyl dehydratase [Rhodospirillaceae bacterium]MBT5514716.1 acyl dehydratase [Rhodospirillaceae bacterium]MBT6085483.1 acyl dehydratase [Rhodospirillaceae bacterium]MBT6607204.1 acyl dehydratase [Rhodospirillaceae bacterium]
MKDAETDIPILGLGLTWEDYSVGQKFKSLARTITEADIVNFIGVTGMVETLFTDLTFTKGAAQAGRVAPAALTYTICEGILCQTVIQGTGLALLEVSKKVLAPVVAGDTVHGEVEVMHIRQTSKGNRAVIKTSHEIKNQRGEVVITYQATRLVSGRDGG